MASNGMTADVDSAGVEAANVASLSAAAATQTHPQGVRWSRVFAGVGVVFVGLTLLPGRATIPPLVESDYCYQLIAANRMYEGLGPTSLQPVAPLQPWEWQYDWGVLTQWPVGYSLLVWAVRRLSGFPPIAAGQWISVAACAFALVGWFVWVRRSVPRGVTGTLLAAVAAGCSVSVAMLINPSTDAILVALVPFVLLATVEAVERLTPGQNADRGVIRARSASDGVQACASQVSPLTGLAEHGVPKTHGSRRGLKRAAPDGAGSLPDELESLAPDEIGNRRTRASKTHPRTSSANSSSRRAMLWFMVAGLLAGGLFWIRYASIFVPLAVGGYLLAERVFRRRLAWRHVGVFGLCAITPILALLIVNSAFGAGPTQAQLNLGSSIGFYLTPAMLGRAWWNFTDFGFYDYHESSHWIFALWPLVVVGGALFIRPPRRAFGAFMARTETTLSVFVVATLLAVLVGATAFFGDKFDYVGLERYYQPIKPLYLLLFAAPVLLIPRRAVRAVAFIGLVVACSWLAQHEWPRTYQRWLAADRKVAPSGQWARCFTPNASALYEWLEQQAGPELIVVSNFHEYITFETGIPALPIPPDEPTLNRWIERIAAARHITNHRVLFVFDRDNKWRDYWIPKPKRIIQSFALQNQALMPATVSAQVFEYDGPLLHMAAGG